MWTSLMLSNISNKILFVFKHIEMLHFISIFTQMFT